MPQTSVLPFELQSSQLNSIQQGDPKKRQKKKNQPPKGPKLTDQNQPNRILKPHQGQHAQHDPQRRLDIDTQPEKALVCHVLARFGVARFVGAAAAVLGFEDPVGVAGGGVDFVPPAEADEASAGDVLEVVEIGGEEEHGEDEYEDTSGRGLADLCEEGGRRGEGGMVY